MHDNKNFYREILNALSDPQIMSIINCTHKNAKSMNQIVRETDISRTTVHRKINSLIKDELLGIENFLITVNGKKSRLFRSRINSIKVKYEGNDMFVLVEENTHIKSKISMLSRTNDENNTEYPTSNSEENIDLDYLLVT